MTKLNETALVTDATFMLGDTPLAVLGDRVQVGQKAPEVRLADGWITATNMLESTAGKIRLISVIPCISTSVCDTQTRRMNMEAAALGEQVVVLTISTDPPPVQGVWCGAAGVDRVKMLSDHQDLSFALAYGVYVKEMRAHQRSLFVVDQDDVLQYVEYVPDIALYPDYEAALAVVQALLKP